MSAKVSIEDCVHVANVAGGGPEGDGMACRSCGRWHGEEHHVGCPIGVRLEAQVEAPPVEVPVGVRADAPVKPRRRRSKKASE